MIIVDRHKDYYDYLVGIRGRDEHVVFDRRSSIILYPNDTEFAPYLSSQRLPDDKPKEMRHVRDENDHWTYRMAGKQYWFLLSIGYTHYKFVTERWLNKHGVLEKTTCIVKWRNSDKITIGNSVLRIIFNGDHDWFFPYDEKAKIAENPILKNTCIPSLISAETIYDTLYNYILATKEPPVADNRNDIQKLESKGFDKKTSFRHPVKAFLGISL
jgi:hypothetical protein